VTEAGRLYDELIKKIFSKSPAPLAYSNLVLRTAQYNENVWEDVLKVLIGETLLIDSMGGPQVCTFTHSPTHTFLPHTLTHTYTHTNTHQGLNSPKFFVLSCNPAKLYL
jgi:hypothetical protein